MARPIHFLRLSVCVAFALTSLLHSCGDEPASPTQETDVVASDLKDQADSDAGESDLRGDTIHDTDGDPALPELS